MGNEAAKTTEAASDLNPNGFVTDRKIDGERRSLRHYNDGRVSGRGRSVGSDLRTKMHKNCTKTRGRARPLTSHPGESSDRSTPAAGPSPSDIAEITAAVAKLKTDHPTSAKVKRLSKKLNPNADSTIETVTLRKVTSSSVASVVSSRCSTGSRSSVNARIADIEDRIRNHIKPRLLSIREEDEE
ncbi:uncharacterized protein N7500_006501 [Penicillium coprophilum]|uniref:uncharacterized protein n=1 Tax=Penicillium coprophilum TaxID=36646 RepID=UPI00238CA404|nr:uncharacterized protein N7500_006501 [Penicillium coprophilum]KAJ5164671.1 hypothetical protein N7500_006501 [Penicillium coprophilum]